MKLWTPMRRAAVALILFLMVTVSVFAARGDLFVITNSSNADVFRITSAGDVVPGADNTYDLGTAALSFQDAHVQGTLTVGTVSATTVTGAHNGTVGATTPAAGTFTTLTATGDVTMNDAGADNLLIGAAADTVTITSDTLSLTDDNWSVSDAGVAAFLATTVTSLAADSVTLTKESARTIKIAASTTDDTAGAALTVAAADGAPTGDNNGGNLQLNGGNATNGGTDGLVDIGATNTSAITLAVDTTAEADLVVAGNLALAGSFNYGVDSVGTDAYAVTLTPAPAAYVTGMVIIFKAGTANTGACSIDVNGLGVKNIKLNGTSDPGDNEILAGMAVMLVYDGTNFLIVH